MSDLEELRAKVDHYRELARLAVQVAIDAPLKQAKYTARGGVYWTTIDEIRSACDAAGIDWRKHHPQTKKKDPS